MRTQPSQLVEMRSRANGHDQDGKQQAAASARSPGMDECDSVEQLDVARQTIRKAGR